MTKAKTIDRLEWTRKRTKLLETRGHEGTQEQEHSAFDIPPDIDIHRLGNICPNCKQPTLIHQEGCVKCPSCLWTACG